MRLNNLFTARHVSVLLLVLAGLIAMCGQSGWGWFLLAGMFILFISQPIEIEFNRSNESLKKEEEKKP